MAFPVYGGVSPKHPRLAHDRQALPEESRGTVRYGAERQHALALTVWGWGWNLEDDV